MQNTKILIYIPYLLSLYHFLIFVYLCLQQGHSNQSSSQHDHGVRATSVPMVPHVQDSHTETQRVRDDKVGRMKDQVIRAKAYLSFATSAGNTHLVRELRLRIKEVERALSRVKKDSDLSRR